MKKRTSEDFVKSLPAIDGTKKASPHLKKTIKVFNGKAGGETAMIEPPKNEKLVIHGKTKTDKFFDYFESHKPWAAIGIALCTAFVAAVAYWGIKQ